jgi:hypothetical protein
MSDYTVYVVKCGISIVAVASKIPKEELVEIFKTKGFLAFCDYIKKSPRVSYMDIPILWIGGEG